ncbi:hypothetical protein Tco_0483334 [Tanacetum coccineum]
MTFENQMKVVKALKKLRNFVISKCWVIAMQMDVEDLAMGLELTQKKMRDDDKSSTMKSPCSRNDAIKAGTFTLKISVELHADKTNTRSSLPMSRKIRDVIQGEH